MTFCVLENLPDKRSLSCIRSHFIRDKIGCGGGILTENLARLGAHITALDLSENMIEIARQHLAKDSELAMANRIDYKVEAIEQHAIHTKNFYDAIVISEVLENIDDKEEFLAAGIETLKPGGSVFITTNKTYTMWLVGVLFGEYIHRSIPIGTHHYGKMISPRDVERILNGFELSHATNNMSLQSLKSFNRVLIHGNRLPIISWSFVRNVKTNENVSETNAGYNLSKHTQSEVKHHSDLAIDWWNVNGPMRALHSLNKIRVPFICDGLRQQGKLSPNTNSETLTNQQILEIGCGGGILTENLASLSANVTGLDLSENLISLAQAHLAKQPKFAHLIQYKVEPIETHAMARKNHYDAIVISEVLEHIDDKIGFLTASVDAVKPGGSIFITTLNKTLTMWVVGVLIGEYMLQAIPIGTHHYNKMISPADVERILKTLNCDTILVKGSSYNFFRNSWRWINSTSMFYALHAVKRQ
ncbi:ubiquinone biosynthesis O-methyltransferase, mitochondrial-like [Musca vetustissima]|uniref:ubiquinone biosynthesis O-methyltransferase, mitochondrial-like n=1 Tax=Musca vetustissima TaxID=27455 RepID=UPI002AB78188|nr:ubiquinone biosynthesis O-methyltransferase, mitochondrial-like [Musca vetustissima]